MQHLKVVVSKRSSTSPGKRKREPMSHDIEVDIRKLYCMCGCMHW